MFFTGETPLDVSKNNTFILEKKLNSATDHEASMHWLPYSQEHIPSNSGPIVAITMAPPLIHLSWFYLVDITV